MSSSPRQIRSGDHWLDIRADDTFLVSYPKSGNTWMRFMLANLISRAPKSFQDANNLVPDIHNERTPEILSDVPSPRIIKSHFPCDPSYPRVIYLVRDPRSVCVSQYFFKKRRGEIDAAMKFEEFLQAFLHGFDDGFGNWGDHVEDWLDSARNRESLIVLRFEDLKADTAGELSRVSDFAGIATGRQAVRRAIAASTMEAMRKIEMDTGLGQQLKDKGDLSIPFVRRGSTTEWREFFSTAMNRKISEAFAPAMELSGYA